MTITSNITITSTITSNSTINSNSSNCLMNSYMIFTLSPKSNSIFKFLNSNLLRCFNFFVILSCHSRYSQDLVEFLKESELINSDFD